MLERKLRTVDEGVQLTDKLARFSDNLRAPLTGFVNQAVQSGDLAADNLQSRDPGRLRQQTASLDQLTDQITRLAPAIAALDKQIQGILGRDNAESRRKRGSEKDVTGAYNAAGGTVDIKVLSKSKNQLTFHIV